MVLAAVILPCIALMLGAAVAPEASSRVPTGKSGDSAPYNWSDLFERTKERTDPEGRLLLAAALVNLGRLKEAQEQFEFVSQTEHRAFALQVINRYQALLEENPEDLLALHLVAYAYYALERYDQAVSFLERAIKLEPRNVWPKHILALAYGKLNRAQDGIDQLKEALELDPGNQYTHLLLSMAYFQQKNVMMAVFHYLRAPDIAREFREYVLPGLL